jgi:amidohydrolase
VSAGTTANAIPGDGIAEGTVRCLDDDAWQAAPGLLKELIDSVASAYGVSADMTYVRNIPPTVNDAMSSSMIAAAVEQTLGPDAVVSTPQSLGGEDFAWYLESVPGAYARLGVRTPGAPEELDLHRPTFDVDERAIGVGVHVMAATALNALWDDSTRITEPLEVLARGATPRNPPRRPAYGARRDTSRSPGPEGRGRGRSELRSVCA